MREDGLGDYRRKRRFSRTPEPAGAPAPARRHTGREAAGEPPPARIFVVHQHAARRLHYDLRLELGGTLKSWAVPKGPSIDPAERRLAVQVEDHPLEYASFEGVIPAGEYGAGRVIVWDAGTWEPAGDGAAGLERGELKFRLNGAKLRGGWVLVRLRGHEKRQNQWLLIKEKDGGARPGEDILAARPESILSGLTIEQVSQKSPADGGTAAKAAGESSPGRRRRGVGGASGRRQRARAGALGLRPEGLPGARRAARPPEMELQLATLVDAPPAGEGWVHEIKFDGYRVLGYLHEGTVRLVTRGGQDWTDRFAELAGPLAALPLRSALLDGEVVAFAEDGRSSFEALQQALSTGHREGRRALVAYVLFDLLYLDGYDLRATPLRARKDLLQRLLAASPASAHLRFSEHVEGQGAAFLQAACGERLEGVVSKLASGAHRDGRTREWLKSKCRQRQEFIIGGFTEPRGSRGGFGALLLGTNERGGLRYVGKVGSGFTEEELAKLRRLLDGLAATAAPFVNVPRSEARRARWVKPDLVVEVGFSGWTGDGRVRQAAFLGLREDKPAAAVAREPLAAAPASPAAPEGAEVRDGAGRAGAGNAGRPRAAHRGAERQPPQGVQRPERARAARAGAEVAGVKITHPDRVVYSEEGITKVEVARYFAAVWPVMLPHVVSRPLTLVRCPEGSDGGCFFQKHVEGRFGAAVRQVTVIEEDGPAVYPQIDSLEGLLGLVQMGTLEIHTWGSTAKDPEHPDQLVFDLDPGPDVLWARVLAVARQLARLLEQLGLASFVKTSGGKGLHVVVPLRPQASWDQVKAFARGVAEHAAANDPEHLTTNMARARRQGRVFIDYLRNGRGATSVVAYSPRARPGAPVSAPLRWDELAPRVRAASFTVRSAPGRLRALRNDPWAGFEAARRPLPGI